MKIMNDENMAMTLLPEERFEPCRVCGEPSSGWHCGAVTCEACKKFFLRSINGEDAKYRCIRSQECVIVRTTRTQCQYCRFQKCKEVGMTNSESPNSPTVAELFKSIGCHVCQAPASGIHFGAITCEGCKGFFRRSIKERAPERYKCQDNGHCEINATSRNMCRYCRFQRCLKVGMSAQNSRIGRQSNLFKHTILEWKSRGLTNINTYQLMGQRKTTTKRIKTESTTTTTTTTLTMATASANLSLMSNSSTLSSSSSSSSRPSTSSTDMSDLNMMASSYQQHHQHQQQPHRSTMMSSASTSGGGGGGYHSQSMQQQQQQQQQQATTTGTTTPHATQQIIAVNQFTTNQYIINTGGAQPSLGGVMPPPVLPDNLMKLTTTAANTTTTTTVLGAAAVAAAAAGQYAAATTNSAAGGYYSGAQPSAWYNNNDFNLDLNNNQIGYGMAVMPSQSMSTMASSSQLGMLPAVTSHHQSQPTLQQHALAPHPPPHHHPHQHQQHQIHQQQQQQHHHLALPAPHPQQQQQQPPQHQQSSHSSSHTEDQSDFDQASRDLIKTVYKSYITHMRPEILTDKTEIMPFKATPTQQAYQRQQALPYYNNQMMQPPMAPSYSSVAEQQQQHYDADYHTFHEILGYFKFYLKQHIKFLEEFQEFKQLSSHDREELVRCSIHSAVVFAIHRGCDFLNYFNAEPDKFEKFLKVFPCFERCNVFMKKLRDKFEKHRLDDKEIALYLAILSFTTAHKNFDDYALISAMREKLGTALRFYMSRRRNEEIVCDDILMSLAYFKILNQELVRDIALQYPYKRDPTNPRINEQYIGIEKILLPA